MMAKAFRSFSFAVALSMLASASFAESEGQAPATTVLFQNVRVFDGRSDALSAPSNVLVRGNKIDKISAEPLPADSSSGATIIEGAGRTLMPGLIDAHAHLSFNTLALALLAVSDPNYLQIRQAAAARGILMDGFTSVRDLGGPVFGLKRAIDEGYVEGPRIWPSGAPISQTSGHFDYRTPAELPSSVDTTAHPGVRFGYNGIADGVDAVHTIVREQLMQGASQVKLAVGGGVSSNYDPIDVTEYTKPELEAAVADAENWGTYVAVHAYTPRAIQLAVDSGVRSIEHGHLIDEPTMKLLAERGVWLSLQPFLEDEDAIPTAPGSDNEAKYKQVAHGTDTAYRLAKQYGVNVAFGTDIQFNPAGIERQRFYLPKLTRWYTPAEALKQATHDNAELLAMSGPRNPYPGKLGVVEEGALADLLLVDGDPLTDLKLVENPAKNFVVIMKDGQIYKNTLDQ
jgi:imidazolonepropionase-like amidohydrolase